MIDGTAGVLVRDLVEELYDKAGSQGNWMVVRQVGCVGCASNDCFVTIVLFKMAGILEKRANGLSHAVTDLLVRQKQVTVGLPQEPKETTITK